MEYSPSSIVREKPLIHKGWSCAPAVGGFSEESSLLRSLFQLTKPKIMLLVIVTGATALVLEGSFLTRPLHFILFLIGLYMTGGAANAFNQYFEHDIDARMSRTKNRRPIPMGRLSPKTAFWFSSALAVSGVALLGVVFNILTAILALATIQFYSLVYTLWLKKNTPQNIVIGGIAGAMAPVGAWAAATGSTAPTPWILFAIVFLWTPPHFWSLALRYHDDYRATGLPMMPLAKGTDGTLRRIFYYTLGLVAVSFLYGLTGGGWLYLAAAIILGGLFIYKTFLALRSKQIAAIWAVFTYSILYLFGLFITMVVDKLI
jgi:protoheme IX farnesyltransferase